MSEDDLEELQVRVAIPPSADPGLYAVTLTLDSDIGIVTQEIPVQVMEPFDVTITNFTITPESPRMGDEVTFSADVTVNGPLDIPDKQVALYITELGQAKITFQTVDLVGNASQTVSLTWTADHMGLLTTRLYVNPTANETSTANNQVQEMLQVLPAQEPCALADQVYDEALTLYEADCSAATSQLTIAKALYEQCGDLTSAAECDMLMEQCEQYALADDLENQGDALADAGDCAGAKVKWNAAIAIYEQYADQDMIDALDNKIDGCIEEPVVVDDDPFYVRYWWAIALAVVAVVAVAAFAMRRKRRLEGHYYPSYAEHEEGDDLGLLGSEFEREIDPREALLAEMEGREPVSMRPAGTVPATGDVKSFIAGLDDALVKLTPEAIKEHLKESVKVYGKIIEKRNDLIPEMDEGTLAEIDARIHEISERIFRAL
jgi:tetratricopeptide (TPR) repeat protein